MKKLLLTQFVDEIEHSLTLTSIRRTFGQHECPVLEMNSYTVEIQFRQSFSIVLSL